MESLLALKNQVFTWTFVPLAGALILLATVGSGFWNTRWKKLAWALGLVALAAAFAVGMARNEWGEVLFNGQIL